MERSKFIVLSEKKLVVCIIDAYGASFRGVAKCNQNDTFDEKTGKRIAYLRADNKRKRANVKYLKNFRIDYVDRCINKLIEDRNRLAKSVTKNLIAIANNNIELEKFQY